MKLIKEFKKTAGDIPVIDNKEEKAVYSHDIGDLPSLLTNTLFNIVPYFVVQPENREDIKKVLRFANDKKITVIPRGAASWGFGGVIPVNGGITLDLSPMRRIINFDKKNKTITVEAGARWSDIDTIVKKDGLSLMTYPSSKFSTVAGWIATGGYGINSFKYGHISKQIKSITVITPSSEEKKLTPDDAEFDYVVSSEGQFGIISEITLALRESPKNSLPHLFYFRNDRSAFEFIENVITNTVVSKEIIPNVIRFLDKNHMEDTDNIIHADVFKKKAAVLIEFDDPDDDKKFKRYLTSTDATIDEAPHYAASYLWNERLFGMKTKRLGPTILACEVTIPINKTADFIEEAKKIGHNFGVEVGIDSYILDERDALVMATFLCDSRKLKYFINLAMISILTKIAVSMGAKPYGLGIWNAPFINSLFGSEQLAKLTEYKKKLDPNNIMNRGKFFNVGSKWFNIPSIIFKPPVFSTAIGALITLSPVLGRIIILLLGKNKKVDKLDIQLSTHACAKCGNCIAVCPAYLITKNENVTAKGKVALAKKLLSGKGITKQESDTAFLCMHCKACEEVCQTNLELIPLWETVEEKLEKRFGRPQEAITEFLKKVDESEKYWEMVERNS